MQMVRQDFHRTENDVLLLQPRLLPEERSRSMAEFYIGIGKLHANTELLNTIKTALFYYAERIANIQKEIRDLDESIKNPTRA